MNCDRVQLLLNAYVDGELDLVTSLEIEEHLRRGDDCSRQYQTLLKLHAAAGDKSLYYSAPAALETRIRSSLKKANQTSQPKLILSWPWLVPAAALVVILLFIGWSISRGLFVTNQDTLLAQEVQTAHVRSLMANHLMDIASTDMHTVKPWFNGKLDFSPPVTDLVSQGYPLVGGRLDALNGRPVAALVYQRNKHFINLFIWPSQDGSQGLQNVTNNGYHIYHWNQSGMTFWAISDLNTDELLVFIDDFQKSPNDK